MANLGARGRLTCLTLLLVVTAAASLPANAQLINAQTARLPEWTPPEPVSSEAVATQPQPAVLLDALGNTTIAWIGTDNSLFEHQGLVVRRKPVASSWLPEQVLDVQGSVNAALAADSAGNVTVAYARAPGTRGFHRSYPYAMTAASDGNFAPPVQLDSRGRVWSSLQLVVGPDGTAVAAWVALMPEKHRRVMVARRPAGGSWHPARILSRAGMSPKEVRVDVGEGGDVTVLWFGHHYPADAWRVWARTLAADQWLPTVLLSDPEETWVDRPQLVAGPRGTAMAAWTHSRDEFAHRVTAKRRPDGTWTEPRPVPGPPAYGGATLARSAHRILMAWPVYDRKDKFARLFARVHENGAWGKTVQLAEPIGEIGAVEMDGDGMGNFRVVWEYREGRGSHGSNYEVHTRSLSLRGDWSEMQTLTRTTSGYYESTAISVAGGLAAAVVWKQLDPVAFWGRIHYAGVGDSSSRRRARPRRSLGWGVRRRPSVPW